MKYAGIARKTGLILVMILSIVSNVKAARSAYEAHQQEKEIAPRTAGQLLRQPSAEEEWQKQLFSLPALQDQNLESEVAERSVLAAQGQLPLVEEYTRDIWSKVTRLQNFDAIGSTSFNINTEGNLYSNLYIFISESVPPATIKNYLRDVEGLGAILVLRGIIGDDASKFLPTSRWVQSLLCTSANKGECYTTSVDINPQLYKLFDIQVVPTVVYVPDIIKNNLQTITSPDNLIVLSWIGDVALPYVVKKFLLERPFDPRLNLYITKFNAQDGGK